MKGEIQNGPISNMNYTEVLGERLKRILGTTYELSFQRAKIPKQHLSVRPFYISNTCFL